MSFEIPPGLTDLLQEFTVNVLRDRPPDLIEFASVYFNRLNDSRKSLGLGGVRFQAPESADGRSEEEEAEDEGDEDVPLPGELF